MEESLRRTHRDTPRALIETDRFQRRSGQGINNR